MAEPEWILNSETTSVQVFKKVSAPYSKTSSPWRASFQRWMGWICLLPFGGFLVFLLKYVGRYQIAHLSQHRRFYKELMRSKKPLIICANHLTFIDSALMIWAFGSNVWYFFHYHFFSWNLPAGDFFKKKFYFRIIAYLCKCLFIHRDGTKEHRDSVLDVCLNLVKAGDVLTIFPEGKRSRSGQVDLDKVTFGVGKLISQLDECQVLCVYLRGNAQSGYSNYPKRGSKFYLDYQIIEPKTKARGREAYRDITYQIMNPIKQMEEKYFRERN